MENIIFWLIVIGTGVWSVQWLFNINTSFGHRTMIIPILLLWGMIIYFFIHPRLSKYHMLWVSPLIIILEFIGSTIVFRIIRKN